MVTSKITDRRRSTVIALAALMAGIAFLARTLAGQSITSMDFRYIWTAGQVWGRGHNPYSPEFVALGRSLFPQGVPINTWLYPPHWYGIARLTILLPPAPSYALWVTVSSAVLASCWILVWKAAQRAGISWTRFDLLASSAYASTTTIVSLALREGQPAVVAQCGIALAIYGLISNRRLVATVGTCLALLKPTLALPLLIGVCFIPGAWAIIGIAVVLTALASLPSFMVSGGLVQISGWLSQSRDYQAIVHNSAVDLTGATHAILLSGAREISLLWSVLVASAMSAALGLWWRMRSAPPQDPVGLLVGCLLITATIEALHTYDLVIILFTLPFMPSMTNLPKLVALGGFVLMWRPENLSRILTHADRSTATIVTAGIFLVVIGWLLFAVRQHFQQRPYSSSSRTMSSSPR